jgi:hypothetical protein
MSVIMIDINLWNQFKFIEVIYAYNPLKPESRLREIHLRKSILYMKKFEISLTAIVIF